MTSHEQSTSGREASFAPSGRATARLRQIRKARGLGAADLAARCAELGAPHLTEHVIWNLETARRHLTLDDFLALAAALEVPPLSLLLPADDPNAIVEITPDLRLGAARVAAWVAGEVPLPGRDAGAFAQAAAAVPSTRAWTERPEADVDARTRFVAAHVQPRSDALAAEITESVRAAVEGFLDRLARRADDDVSAAEALRQLENLGLDVPRRPTSDGESDEPTS
ncbi:MAG: helix-turn-helix domain-containing protein [Stackebrandtia sp.]